MERSFKRISEEVKLPRESRERIRSRLASHQLQQEDFNTVKKANIKRSVFVVAAVVVLAAALTVTAAAAGTRLFRNNIIVSSLEDVPRFTDSPSGVREAVGINVPSRNSPLTLETITQIDRYKSDGWATGDVLDGGIMRDYVFWDYVEVLSSDPALRSRRMWHTDGAEKMEYTAENPINLLDTLTGRVMIDLSWMDDHYDYVPDANMSFVVTDEEGNYVGEEFRALYAKPDGKGYVRVELRNMAEADFFSRSYIVDGIYETAYYYTTPDGYEFLIKMHTGNVWVDCDMSHASVSLFGAYLTSGEVEDILDNLSLTVEEQP